MLPAAFIEEIAGPGRRPLYVLSGGEPTAVARCLAAALETAAPGLRDFNCPTLELEAGQADRLLGEARTRPFGPPPRVVMARNPAFKAEDWQTLADYLENPNPETVILLVLRDKLDERLRFSKKIKAENLEVDCLPPRGEALVKWLANELKSRGVTASAQVSRLIIERALGESQARTADDLNILLGEAEKLSLYLRPERALTDKLAQDLVRPVLDAQLYHLTDHLGRGQIQKALADLLEIMSDRHQGKDKKKQSSDPSHNVLGALENRFLAFLDGRARTADAADWPTPKFMANLKPFTRKTIQEQSGRWPWPELARALAALEEARLTLISSGSPPSQPLLENLLLKLADPGQNTR